MPGKTVLDANVLYSARLRDLWMELAVAGVVDIVWTERVARHRDMCFPSGVSFRQRSVYSPVSLPSQALA